MDKERKKSILSKLYSPIGFGVAGAGLGALEGNTLANRITERAATKFMEEGGRLNNGTKVTKSQFLKMIRGPVKRRAIPLVAALMGLAGYATHAPVKSLVDKVRDRRNA